MTDKNVRKILYEFSDEILSEKCTLDTAKDIKRRLEDFCRQNNVSIEQLDILAESGAGEMLNMLTT